MTGTRLTWTRLTVLLMSIITVAIDAGRVPVFDSWVWTHTYVVSAGMLAGWMVSRRPVLLTLFYGSFLVATLVRGLAISTEGRYAGAALNVIIAVLLVDFVHNRRIE